MCPPRWKLYLSLFTVTAAVDNIDCNPSLLQQRIHFIAQSFQVFSFLHGFEGHHYDMLVLILLCCYPAIKVYKCANSLQEAYSTYTLYLWLMYLQGPLTFRQLKKPKNSFSSNIDTASLKQQSNVTDWTSWCAYHASVQEAIIPLFLMHLLDVT